MNFECIDWNAISAIATFAGAIATFIACWIALKIPSLKLDKIYFENLKEYDKLHENIFYQFKKELENYKNPLSINYIFSNIGAYPVLINHIKIYKCKISKLPIFIFNIQFIRNIFLKDLEVKYTYYLFNDNFEPIKERAIRPFTLIRMIKCLDFDKFTVSQDEIKNLIFIINFADNKKIFKKLKEAEIQELKIIIEKFNNLC